MSSEINEKLRIALEEVKDTIIKQNTVIKELTTAPLKLDVVISSTGPLTIGMNGAYTRRSNLVLKPGDMILLNEYGAITDRISPIITGKLNNVVSVNGSRAEVETANGTSAIVRLGDFPHVKRGDRVLLDKASTVILYIAPKDTKIEEQYAFMRPTNVTWDDIGGLKDAKRELKEIIEEPIKYAALYKYFNRKQSKGILMFGSPGNGKTLLAEAAATAIAKTHNKPNKGFFYIKGPEILTKWVGETEQIVRAIFEQGRRFKQENGFSPILFIDEADAILSKRGSSISSDLNKTIVPMFLAEMDGLNEQGAIVILATNRADSLDEAVVRDGRIDSKIKISRPTTLEETAEVFGIHFRKIPVRHKGDITIDAAKELFSSEHAIYILRDSNNKIHNFCLQHLSSGAMIAGIVQSAVQSSIRRAIETKSPTSDLGVTLDDIKNSVKNCYKQNLNINQGAQVQEFASEMQIDITNVSRVQKKEVELSCEM